MKILRRYKLLLFSPCSPGDRVVVYRTWFGLMIKNRDFATFAEIRKARKNYDKKPQQILSKISDTNTKCTDKIPQRPPAPPPPPNRKMPG